MNPEAYADTAMLTPVAAIRSRAHARDFSFTACKKQEPAGAND